MVLGFKDTGHSTPSEPAILSIQPSPLGLASTVRMAGVLGS